MSYVTAQERIAHELKRIADLLEREYERSKEDDK